MKYYAKLLHTKVEREEYYRLRYPIFSRWVGERPTLLERDQYDDYTDFQIGVYDQLKIVAGIRCIRHPKQFMFVDEYEGLFKNTLILKGGHVSELSRFTIEQYNDYVRILRKGWEEHPASLLFGALYHQCVLSNIQFIYAATYPVILHYARLRGYPFQTVKIVTQKSNNEKIELGLLNWREFENENNKTYLSVLRQKSRFVEVDTDAIAS